MLVAFPQNTQYRKEFSICRPQLEQKITIFLRQRTMISNNYMN